MADDAPVPIYTFRLSDLPKLDLQVDRGTDFTAWRLQWDSYSQLSGLIRQPAEKQVQALSLCFSRETLVVVQNLGLTDEARNDVSQIIQALQRYVDGHVNETVERRTFRKRVQQQGETFDDFLISLRELAKTCKFCSDTCKEKSIRDQIIEGCSDGDTIEDLLQESDLSLAKAVTICRSREAAKRHRHEIHTTEMSGVAGVSAMHKPRQQQQMAGPICQGCGYPVHQGGRRQCPAYNQVCMSCHKVGHFAKVCRSRNPRPPPSFSHSASPQTQQADTQPGVIQSKPGAKALHVSHDQHQLQLYTMQEAITEPAPTVTVDISSMTGTHSIEVLPDSGADISAAGPEVLAKMGHHKDNILTSNITPRTVNGLSMTPLGRVPVTMQLGQVKYEDNLHIYPGISGALLSWRAAKALRILPSCYPLPIPMGQPSAPLNQLAKLQHPGNPPSQQISQDLMDQYPTVFDGQIRIMAGETFHITLVENAVPFCVKTPRSIPFAYRDKLKAELDLLLDQNIIAPVTEVTDWCAPIVVTPKKGSDRIRMCVDLSRLNRYVKRERFQSPTPAEAVADIAASEATYFTIIDAAKGYHQCPLDTESQLYTTFITPFGRYKYLRAPYGLSSIAEHYNRRMAEAFEGLTGHRRVVDDVVIYDKDRESHIAHVHQFLQRCRDKQISLNKDKCDFCQMQVTFAGFQLSSTGYRIHSAITDAVSQFPTPATRSDLRSFFGLANQLSSSTDMVSKLLLPLRSLLSTKHDFLWSAEHDRAFSEAKTKLTEVPTLAYFSLDKQTRLCTDASRQGLGFVLQQLSSTEQWNLVQAGSRFLTPAESRYAVIELELLAVAWAVAKCHMFLGGLQHFTVVTDHNPLIPILNSHRLDEIENPRLQRLRARLMAYNLTAVWCKGTAHAAPDALSRHPILKPTPEDSIAEVSEDQTPEPSISEIRICQTATVDSLRLTELLHHANSDEDYAQLKDIILKGFPSHKGELPQSCRPYWQVRHNLTIDEDLIIYGCRLLIPYKLRREVLKQLHESHQGTQRTKQRARLTVYWPGIDNDIDNLISQCHQCQSHLPANPKEPMIAKPRPSRPFEELAADFCYHAGRCYLIIVDCYTDWPTVVPMGKNVTAAALVTVLRELFCRTAVPDLIWSDGGPQFTSRQFQSFAAQWGFKHQTSSPHYPQSNGKAEAAVKSMKRILRAVWNGRYLDGDKLCKALLQYRNTPSLRDGLSPAQKLFGHPLQDTIPAHPKSFDPQWQPNKEETAERTEKTQQTAIKYYNRTAKPLPEIHVGSQIALQDPRTKLWDTYGIVVGVGPHRQYMIKTAAGQTLTRNRKFIKRRVPLLDQPQSSCPAPVQDGNTRMSQQLQRSTSVPEQPRRSTRQRKPTRRLIEDPTWNNDS